MLWCSCLLFIWNNQQTVLILDSRFWEGKTHIWGGGGGKFDAFFNVFCFVFWVFFWGEGEFGILGEGGIPPGDSWKIIINLI